MAHHALHRERLEQPLQERVRTVIPAQRRPWASGRTVLLAAVMVVAVACLLIVVAISLV
jgi:hypothetical protein